NCHGATFRQATRRSCPTCSVPRNWVYPSVSERVDFQAMDVEQCGFGAERGEVAVLVAQRHRHIVEALESAASVSTIELARTLRVSQETIRRDLIQLEQHGALRRVYGGAVTLHRQRSSEPPFAQRSAINAEAKRVVGEVAAQLVRPGQTVFVDVGTTAQAA